MNCRICKKEIKEGTLCRKCLFSLSDEVLTLEERKQRNNTKGGSDAQKARAIIILFVGIFMLFLGISIDSGVVDIIGLVVLILGIVDVLSAYGIGKSISFCPACQRKDCLEVIKKDLIGEQRTTITETRKIEKKYNEGSTNREILPETYEMQVDVPAMRRTYRITYKCNKCGYVGTETQTSTDKI